MTLTIISTIFMVLGGLLLLSIGVSELIAYAQNRTSAYSTINFKVLIITLVIASLGAILIQVLLNEPLNLMAGFSIGAGSAVVTERIDWLLRDRRSRKYSIQG